VDANCYRFAVQNVNPTDTSMVDRDMQGNVDSCRPKQKTKRFAIVEQDWSALPLDRAGDAKVLKLISQAGTKGPIRVTVTGEQHGKTIDVRTIVLSRR